MAGDNEAGEEEGAIELQIEQQLEVQKESLVALDDALAVDPANTDLLSVREELVMSIKDAEEGLLHLKRSRLLQEADAITSKLVAERATHDCVEPFRMKEPEMEPVTPEKYTVGSKCRFRHSDGRWYNGYILGLEDATSARISFLNPTSENMLICKFFLQQRCRFGSNCRMSHGRSIPTSSLKHHAPTVWQQSLVGSSIWAVSDDRSGIWKEAEFESWDDKLKLAQVLFQDGSAAKLGVEAIALSQYAPMTDEEEEEEEVEEDSSSETNASSEDEEDLDDRLAHQGIGFLESTLLQSGVQTDTALFAKWENHTRGIASKMMAGMGYREGMGLGASGQGILDPISIKVLPPKQSLDHAVQSEKSEHKKDGGKKRSRGGRRKRDKRFAEAARAAKAEQEPESNVFSFINDQLAGQKGNNNLGNKQKKVSDKLHESMKKGDRRSLVAYEDKVKDLRLQVERLEEMVSRNRKDKVVFEAASRKLNETRKELSDVEAAHSSVSNAVVSQEKEKRWLKF